MLREDEGECVCVEEQREDRDDAKTTHTAAAAALSAK